MTGRSSHVANLLEHPLATAGFVADIGPRRVLARRRRLRGFFVYSRDNRYPFDYEGEHLPNQASRVSPSRHVDCPGRRKLLIDLRVSADDVEGVVSAHGHWDRYLRSNGVGRLEYLHRDVWEAVEQRLGGGFHQIGTTRMSASPQQGVVDWDLAVHGVPNLYVASSSVSVSSGQANCTFMTVAFAIRLADHLARQLAA